MSCLHWFASRFVEVWRRDWRGGGIGGDGLLVIVVIFCIITMHYGLFVLSKKRIKNSWV